MQTSPVRPTLMQRNSSASSHASSRNNLASPGSQTDHNPLRHPVRAGRHAKIVLPRNHGSGRNLAKLARQAGNAQGQGEGGGKKQERRRSHEGDTETRLPGSLNDSEPRPMRRNMTAYQLPRASSHVKLKKNLSHGQLHRLNSGKNLAALATTAQKAPLSPGLKGRSRRAKSADMTALEAGNEIHEQEAALAAQPKMRKESAKKVGFAVGSSNDTSEGDEGAPQMDGSGLEEGEWTEESASASPYSTRQNTANSSRRASEAVDKPPDRATLANGQGLEEAHLPPPDKVAMQKHAREAQIEADGTPAQSYEYDEDDEGSPSVRSQPHVKRADQVMPRTAPQPTPPPKASRRSPPRAAKERTNPGAKFLGSRGAQLPAPALVSQISALDNTHSARGSPAPSIKSTQSNFGDGAEDHSQAELVSRFIPSASHPPPGSGGNTGNMNTPKQGSFHTPDDDSTLTGQHYDRPPFHLGPTSPGSTVSGSSGAATPALGRSRTELKMLQEKALADMESATERGPIVPAHVYDRRNESLKSYLNLTSLGGNGRGGLQSSTGLSLGPEIFQGRFKAVNTELKVVQKFHNPIAECVERLKKCKGSKPNLRNSPQKQQAAALRPSKSAVSLPSRHPGVSKQPSKLSTSASPPKTSDSPVKPALVSAKSAVQVGRDKLKRPHHRGVSFAGAPPETHEYERREAEEAGPDAIAKHLWDSFGS